MSRKISMNRKNTIAMAVIVVVVFVVFSIFDIISYRDKQKNCTQSVTAEITNITQSRRKKSSSSNRRSKKIIYQPHFSYEVDGVTYEGLTASVSSSTAYKIGERIQIKVDPEKPSKYLVLSDKSPVGKNIFAIIVSLGILAVALIPKKQNNIR
ncbi:MAG: DUF3592 domain-containing protein [Ruminococcus sp.]|nr:DUF3592 domain-containing protein [Ruminococcus sp.]MDE7098665.1 DUF3592 domain-containing protein [Ruminococcus sp.]